MDDLFDILIESGGREAGKKTSCGYFSHVAHHCNANKNLEEFSFTVSPGMSVYLTEIVLSEVSTFTLALKEPLQP